MSLSKLKSVSFVNAVQFGGQMCQQVAMQYGNKIEMGADFVQLTHADVKRDVVCVPIGNVRQYVRLNEAIERAMAAEAEAKAHAAAAEAARIASARRTAPKGTLKFVKNPDTGIVEEKMV